MFKLIYYFERDKIINTPSYLGIDNIEIFYEETKEILIEKRFRSLKGIEISLNGSLIFVDYPKYSENYISCLIECYEKAECQLFQYRENICYFFGKDSFKYALKDNTNKSTIFQKETFDSSG